ncbi:MAG: acetamidase, partial [Candidatus Heimdallarchaeota archaeon]|nr:acetamidase [Candidatus Heimdallarchaeota archaeon]
MTNGKIHRITMKDVVYNADKNNPPVLTIESGDTVIFECK